MSEASSEDRCGRLVAPLTVQYSSGELGYPGGALETIRVVVGYDDGTGQEHPDHHPGWYAEVWSDFIGFEEPEEVEVLGGTNTEVRQQILEAETECLESSGTYATADEAFRVGLELAHQAAASCAELPARYASEEPEQT